MKVFKHHKYTWTNSFGTSRHNWELVGPRGAINFHVTQSDEERFSPTAGLEFHHIEAPNPDLAPDHVNCYLTGGRCWHDGTSLYATEKLWPLIESYLKDGNHKAIFSILEEEYTSHFRQAEKSV